MAELPTVSVVTPSYNQAAFLAETVESVLSQEGDFSLEYLVMDGGSTDGSAEILARAERELAAGRRPVRCRGVSLRWVSEKDKGQADAVNKGFRAAKGSVLGWLNSDDTYLPGAVANAVRWFADNPAAGMVYGEGWHISKDGERLDRYYTEPFDLERLKATCYILQPTVFLRRTTFEALGPLDEALQYCMDYEYWIRAAKSVAIGYTPRYVANFRVYPENKTSSRRYEINREIVGVAARHFGRVERTWLSGLADETVKKAFGMSDPAQNRLARALRAALFRALVLRYGSFAR